MTNIMVNHAAFWDGKMLRLTPAYDICSQPRTGGEASQAMLIHGNNRMSQLKQCILAAPQFHLSRNEAIALVEEITESIVRNWKLVCGEAKVSVVDKKHFSSHQFFNRFAFENLDGDCKHLEKLADQLRA